jgi:cobalt/nickel transport protein
MRKATLCLAAAVLFWGGSGSALAHFGMLIPSDSMVTQGEKRGVQLTLSFSHPMEMVGMDMAKPEAFGVWAHGRKQDLRGSLKATKVMGHTGWTSYYAVKRPGTYVFFMEPAPYWEPAEDCFIVHYTKTVVTAFGDDEGWDGELGLKTEIVPLARPFALYAGNVFQGIVKLDGKPVPYAEVEVEYYNEDQKAEAPAEYMITQTIKADQNGVFTYAAPRSGWWGFAALSTSDRKFKHDGVEKDVEIGAVIWVRFHDWREKK